MPKVSLVFPWENPQPQATSFSMGRQQQFWSIYFRLVDFDPLKSMGTYCISYFDLGKYSIFDHEVRNRLELVLSTGALGSSNLHSRINVVPLSQRLKSDCSWFVSIACLSHLEYHSHAF